MNSKLAGLFLALVSLSSAQAHDLPVSADSDAEPVAWAPGRKAFMPTDRLYRPAVTDRRLPAAFLHVIVLPNRWAQTQTVRVCFVEGSPGLRDRILKAASGWFPYVNLTLDGGGPGGRNCAPNDQSEIRIGFSEPGFWSYIGHESLHPALIKDSLTSMNFQGWNRVAPTGEAFEGTVLHEFGHALGFHHEHQSPAAGCDSHFDWPKIYAHYWTRYGWPREDVDTNVRELLQNRSAYEWSRLDPDSVMIYETDRDFLIDPSDTTCLFKANNKLSQLDMEGAQRAYPQGQADLHLRLQAASLGVVLGEAIEPSLREALATQSRLSTARIAAD